MDLNQLVADAIQGSVADALVATDRDGIIRLWNPGAERIEEIRSLKQKLAETFVRSNGR